MTITITRDVQKLDPGAKVTVFELDLTPIGGDILYFHAGTDASRANIVWQGQEYTAWPIDVSGFEYNGRGQLPTPTLRVGNIGGYVTALCVAYDDMIGAKFTRRCTLARYLDGAAAADPTAEFPDEVYFVERKVNSSRVSYEFELASALDIEGVMLPLRQCRKTCAWQYRSAECSYAGAAVATALDVPTAILADDDCSRHITGCDLRFPGGPLPFGGFPAASVIS